MFGGESQDLGHRFGRKARVVSRNILTAHSLRQAGENVRDGEPRALNCGLSPQEVGIGDNPLIPWDGFDRFGHGLNIPQFVFPAKARLGCGLAGAGRSGSKYFGQIEIPDS